MPRPCKRRRICSMPRCVSFAPENNSDFVRETVTMTLDEFETIRLIDLESMTQEQCALQMDIARTTAQAIYNSARRKLAQCIVYGKKLNIEGGEYVLCSRDKCGCCRCRSFLYKDENK